MGDVGLALTATDGRIRYCARHSRTDLLLEPYKILDSSAMTSSVPKSNIDIVAFNIANHALVDEANHPGTGLADLFSRMSRLAEEAAGWSRTVDFEWEELNSDYREPSSDHLYAELSSTIDRQMMSTRDSWSLQWALAHIAKHIDRELERECLAHFTSQQIRTIEYDDDANVVSWQQHPTS